MQNKTCKADGIVFDVYILQECISKHRVHTNLNGLAPQRQMGRGVPEIDLLVLATCHKLLSTGMHIQAPQLISVTLSQREKTQTRVRMEIFI